MIIVLLQVILMPQGPQMGKKIFICENKKLHFEELDVCNLKMCAGVWDKVQSVNPNVIWIKGIGDFNGNLLKKKKKKKDDLK